MPETVRNPEFEEEFYACARASHDAFHAASSMLGMDEVQTAELRQVPEFSSLRSGEKLAWNAAAVAAIEKRLGVGQEPELVRMSYEQGGTLDVSVRHPVVYAMTQSMVEYFDDNRGDNYVETTVTSPERGQFVMTVQRKSGKTPYELRAEAEQILKDVAALLHGDLSDKDKISAALLRMEKRG